MLTIVNFELYFVKLRYKSNNITDITPVSSSKSRPNIETVCEEKARSLTFSHNTLKLFSEASYFKSLRIQSSHHGIKDPVSVVVLLILMEVDHAGRTQVHDFLHIVYLDIRRKVCHRWWQWNNWQIKMVCSCFQIFAIDQHARKSNINDSLETTTNNWHHCHRCKMHHWYYTKHRVKSGENKQDCCNASTQNSSVLDPTIFPVMTTADFPHESAHRWLSMDVPKKPLRFERPFDVRMTMAPGHEQPELNPSAGSTKTPVIDSNYPAGLMTNDNYFGWFHSPESNESNPGK